MGVFNSKKDYIFYVYVLRDGDIPFYVGKGCNDRAYQHISEALSLSKQQGVKLSQKHKKIIEMHKQERNVIIDVIPCETENEALVLEERLISYYGRQCNNTGTLTNINAKGGKSKKRPVYAYTLDGTFIKKYESINVAASELNIKSSSNISAACDDRTRSVKNLMFTTKFNPNILPYDPNLGKKVFQYSKDGILQGVFKNATFAAQTLGIDASGITAVCRGDFPTYKGWMWSYDYNDLSYVDNRKKRVNQYDYDGHLIAKHDSVIDAAMSIGVSGSALSNAIRNESYKVGNFLWNFENEPIPEFCDKRCNNSRPVFKFDLNGNLLERFQNLTQAKRNGFKNIDGAISVNNRSAYGFLWSYTPDPPKYEKRKYKSKRVGQYTQSMKLIKTFESVMQAKKETGCNNITFCCKGNIKHSGGYIWKYMENE